MSFLNGLSALGATTAQFAGAAGLEAQKSELQRQSLVLADQLATVRESAGRVQAGEIAAKAADVEHGFQSGEKSLDRTATRENLATTEAGATARNAATNATSLATNAASNATSLATNAASNATSVATNAASNATSERNTAATIAGHAAATNAIITGENQRTFAQIAAAAPGRDQEILASRAKVELEKVQTENAKALQDAHKALQAEITKTDADPTKVSALKSAVTSLETSATTEAATTAAAAAMYRTDMDAVTHYNTQLVQATAQLNVPGMEDKDRAAQAALVANLKKQLIGAQRALEYSSGLVHGRIGSQAGGDTPPGGGTNRPPLSSFGNKSLPNPVAGPRANMPSPIPGLINGGPAYAP